MSINKPFPKETYERWAQMYIEGSTARSIAEKYEVSSYTVIYHLEKLGVKRRSNSESHMYDSNKLLSQHLKEKYGITSSVLTKRVRDKIYPQIRISKQGMSILKEVVKPYLPPSMLYKIGG